MPDPLARTGTPPSSAGPSPAPRPPSSRAAAPRRRAPARPPAPAPPPARPSPAASAPACCSLSNTSRFASAAAHASGFPVYVCPWKNVRFSADASRGTRSTPAPSPASPPAADTRRSAPSRRTSGPAALAPAPPRTSSPSARSRSPPRRRSAARRAAGTAPPASPGTRAAAPASPPRPAPAARPPAPRSPAPALQQLRRRAQALLQAFARALASGTRTASGSAPRRTASPGKCAWNRSIPPTETEPDRVAVVRLRERHEAPLLAAGPSAASTGTPSSPRSRPRCARSPSRRPASTRPARSPPASPPARPPAPTPSPSSVECATLSSCARTASSISRFRWPCTVTQSDETPSRYRRPRSSTS